MPIRKTPLVNGEIYHVVNRGVASMPIFNNAYDYNRFITLLSLYRHLQVPHKFSHFKVLSRENRLAILSELEEVANYKVEIITYCLMPNHYHLLLKQATDNGTSDFIRIISDSHSKYFNKRYERKGPLMEGRFRTTRIETQEQLIHVNRYIHINPTTSYIVKDYKDLLNYKYSSLPEFLGNSDLKICNPQIILNNFSGKESYLRFLNDNVDYQRKLRLIKHKILE